MIESFDKDYELAIDKKMFEKQAKLTADSLKRSGTEVSLEEEVNKIAADYMTGLIDMVTVGNRYEKVTSDRVAAAFKTVMKRIKEGVAALLIGRIDILKGRY